MSENRKVLINNRPYPIPIEMRPLWRISLVILIVHIITANNKNVDLRKLNILLWMVIRNHDWGTFKKFLFDKDTKAPFISTDQANYLAIELAFKKDLIQFSNQKIVLTDQAHLFVLILEENKLFISERFFLENIFSKLTVEKINLIMGKV